MSSAIERSVKDRVHQLANEQQRTFNSVWQALVLERFLARLSRSPYREKLILKGGMLLSYYVDIGRETTDLDFLIRGSSGKREDVETLVRDVSAVDLADGFVLELTELSEVDHLQTAYPGFLAGLVARCGDTKTKVFLDIGIGDVVRPDEVSIRLSRSAKGPLFESEVSLCVYPAEVIFAEKLESACFRGLANSRMKDFHDLWIMSCSPQPLLRDYDRLSNALKDTFANRATSLGAIPWNSNEEHLRQEQYWQAHLRGLETSSIRSALPRTFREVVEQINQWLAHHLAIG